MAALRACKFVDGMVGLYCDDCGNRFRPGAVVVNGESFHAGTEGPCPECRVWTARIESTLGLNGWAWLERLIDRKIERAIEAHGDVMHSDGSDD